VDDLAVLELCRCAAHYYGRFAGRRNACARRGLQWAAMCAAAGLPVRDNVVPVGDCKQYLELSAWESRLEVLAIHSILFSVHRTGRAGSLCHKVRRIIFIALAQVAGIPGIEKGLGGFNVLLLRHGRFSLCGWW